MGDTADPTHGLERCTPRASERCHPWPRPPHPRHRLSTYWGGRLAQALERNPDVEAIVGVDSEDPTRELERTEFVRVSNQHALIRRIVKAAEIDTVVDTRLVVDSAVDERRGWRTRTT